METTQDNDNPTISAPADSADADTTNDNSATEDAAQPIVETATSATGSSDVTPLPDAPTESTAPQSSTLVESSTTAPESEVALQEAALQSEAAAPRRRQPSMAQVMESDEYMGAVEDVQKGALLKGQVMRVDEETGVVLVDIGAKSEGAVPKNELGDDEVSVGDEIEVVVLRTNSEDGHPVVSKRRADYERLWRELLEAKTDGRTIEGTVQQTVKGGIIVDVGVPAFVPASHIDKQRGNLEHLVGKTLPVKIIETERKREKVIASNRRATEEDRRARSVETWKELEKDKIMEGVVRRITDFGAFIDLGGVDGLLHVSEMAWTRVENPGDVVKKGQKLQVLVLDVDQDRRRVALGLKQLQSDPWKKASKSYVAGQTVEVKITHLAQSCAFAELEEGIEGIIPIAEMSEEHIKEPSEVLTAGQMIEARIKQVQPNQRRITLSLRSAAREKEKRETRTAVREVNQRATSSAPDAGEVRLGDLFGQELREMRERGKERAREKKRSRSEARDLALDEEDELDWKEGDDALAEMSDDENVAGDETETLEAESAELDAVAAAVVAPSDAAPTGATIADILRQKQAADAAGDNAPEAEAG